MISFKILEEENVESVVNELSAGLTDDEGGILSEIVSSLAIGEDCDTEFALSVFEKSALIRVFDLGRYLFLFPYALSEDADISAAIGAVSEYAMREEIPLIFSDVPISDIALFSGYRHMDIDAEDAFSEGYRVKINTECMLCEKIPEIDGGRVKLNAIKKEDIPLYAKLCKDENVNKSWGYDYREDVCSPTDEYFYESAAREFASGVAMSMAVRYDGNFAGEAIMYAFDGRGCAEFAIRLLPEYHGKGIGRQAVSLLLKSAESIGLIILRARVMRENTRSLAMMRSFSAEAEKTEDSFIFDFPLH